MWYYNGEIIKTPKTIQIGDLRYSKEIFHDPDRLTELGIKPFRRVVPDTRYYEAGSYSVDTSGDEAIAIYTKVGKNTDDLTKNMLDEIKRQLTSRLQSTDWYYLRKLRTGTDVPSEIQDYSDALYSEYDTKKTEISAMTKMSQIMEYENRPHTEVRKVESKNSEGKTIYGPKTESFTREINMINEWPTNPNDEVDPSLVSLTAD
jgi:hypothetical protein